MIPNITTIFPSIIIFETIVLSNSVFAFIHFEFINNQ